MGHALSRRIRSDLAAPDGLPSVLGDRSLGETLLPRHAWGVDRGRSTEDRDRDSDENSALNRGRSIVAGVLDGAGRNAGDLQDRLGATGKAGLLQDDHAEGRRDAERDSGSLSARARTPL